MVVATRKKNKATHPAAPVMTEAAKIKAGIPSTKHRTKKRTKDKQIQELKARLATAEQPDKMVAVSKDPLVSWQPFFTQSHTFYHRCSVH